MSRSGPEENITFRSLNESIFVIFFLNRPRILRGVHIFAIENPKMKFRWCTVCTTVRMAARMNTGRVGAHSEQYKQEIIPF